MLYEDHVVDAVCRFLEANGWTIVSRAHAHERGDDVVAAREEERLIVEAKGAGSSQAGTARFGQSFTRNQVKTHVGVAVLRAMGVASDDNARAAVALPDDRHHRDIAGRVTPALTRAGIGVFWVADDLTVRADLPW